ncbi:MAG: hypothetical protein ACK5GZ_14370 [Cyanobium sp.]|jgi:hypothetical protein
MTPLPNHIDHPESDLAHPRRPPELLGEWTVATGLTGSTVGES